LSSGNRPSTATPLLLDTAAKTSVSVDVEALTTTITAAVTSTVQSAVKTPHLLTDTPSVSGSAGTTLAPISVEAAVSDQLVITSSPTAGKEKPSFPGTTSNLDSSEKLAFSIVL